MLRKQMPSGPILRKLFVWVSFPFLLIGVSSHYVIFLDFAKAFDKVPHKRLLHKLKLFGFSENTDTYNWIKEFLNKRTQCTRINGILSDKINVTSGVPQGSVLGPLLFLLYINDINENITSNCKLYADDTALYKVIKDASDSIELQNDLDEIIKWSKT